MMLSFHPEAEAEFNKEIDYYENIQAGLGYDFAVEVYALYSEANLLPENGASN